MQDFTDRPQFGQVPAPPRRQSRGLLWLLGGCGVVAVLGCGGILTAIAFLGMYAPDTSVYTGNRVPARFLETVKSVDALDDDETILFFYSDALTDIRDGFYFVSNKKVVIYSQEMGEEPLRVIPFGEIDEAELLRNESFFEDSIITLYLKDGQVVSLPVSSEYDRDEQFFQSIDDRIEK